MTRQRPPVIHAFAGHATPGALVLRGRVLAEGKPRGRTRTGRMIAHFRTRELPGIAVQAGALGTVTDDDGYFTLHLPRSDGHGWVEVALNAGAAQATARVLVPRPDARFGVISDIDDTVMHTGAWSLTRNLWTTLTGDEDSRIVFEDAVALLEELAEAGRNPVYWVSSSPWNLYGFLTSVLFRAGLPEGPLFLRDWGIGPGRFPAGSHGTHKARAIDTILAANPALPFVLVGDTGQHDAQAYAAAATRHPGRVLQVILRHAKRAPSPQALQSLEAAGVPVTVVADYRDLLTNGATAQPEGVKMAAQTKGGTPDEPPHP